jgi:hypothetical protein
MKISFVSRFILVMCMSAVSMIAMAQATRTWVSGVGDDANPGSRTAPCKTFAGAISKTAAGGEINVIDPGGFGAVTITKSITIDGGGVSASILSSGTTGIIINAPNAEVTIRRLSINGAGTGISGIRIIAAKKVTIEDCYIANFLQKGIEVNTSAVFTVVVNNVTIHNTGDGISITGPSSSTGSSGFTVIDRCHIQGVQNTGINIVSGSATVSNAVISGCGIGVGSKTGADVHLSGNVITNNNTALQGPGTITSAGNNSMTGNVAQGVTATVVNLK